MIKRLLIISSIFLFLSGCGKKEETDKQVVVSVSSSDLTMEMINREIPANMQSNVSREQIKNYIQQWIEKELIYQAALKVGLDLDPEYRRELEKAKKEILVREYLDQFLFEKETTIDEAEITKYFEENQESFIVANDEIKAQHILVATQREAEEARRRIIAGEDFEAVAREISIDFAERGRIEFGFFSKEDVVREIGNRVFSYRVGSVTRPIKSGFGYHLFKILEKRGKGEYKTQDEVEDQIKNRLSSERKKMQYRELIIELRNTMIVKKNENYIKEIYRDTTISN